MKKSFCELLQQYYPEPSEAEDFYSTFIANCVFNSFLSYIAIMLNVLTIHAIRKTSSLPKTLKILLLGVLPFLMLVLVYQSSHFTRYFWSSGYNKTIPAVTRPRRFTSLHIYSFSNVAAVSVDRFLDIHLHLHLTSVLLLWLSQYAFLVYLFLFQYCGFHSMFTHFLSQLLGFLVFVLQP